MSWGTPIADVTRDESRVLRDALTVYRTNRWINRAESVISNRVSGVPWHLEDENGDSVTDESSDALKAIRDVFEKPLGSLELARAYPSQPATRRNLWGVTSRHMGLCNVGFWHLDEIDRAMGFPKRIFYIRPDRMTPDVKGATLAGWILDQKAEGGGLHLSLEEILPFYLDQPDKGFFGVGLPESIWSTLAMPSAIDGHALDTLGSGGRLPGVYSPKSEQLNDDTFARITGDLRVLKDMPDAAKRDLVAKVPLDFTPTAADMTSLNVILLSGMSRDDTLTHWGVPLSTIGGTTPSGLNSGDSRKYDEAALWQNAVQFRIDALRETIQLRLLDRLQATGMFLQLVVDVPAFDDDSPKYETANKATNLPLTNNERRALVGLPPLEGPLGNEVRLPMTIQSIGAIDDAEDESSTMDAAKAKLPNLKPLRDKAESLLERDVRKVLDEMRAEIASRVTAKHEHLAKKPGDAHVWWNEGKWRERLEKAIRPHLALAADTTAKRVSDMLEPAGD